MELNLRSRLSARMKLITTLISLILLTAAVMVYIEFHQGRLNLIMLLIVLSICIALPTYFLLVSPRKVSIHENYLQIHFFTQTKQYPLNEISITKPNNFRLSSISGSKGFFGYIGVMNGEKTYIKDTNQVFKVEYKNKVIYYSCESVDLLINQFRKFKS